MQMLPSQLVSASQKHMFQSPLDRHGGGGAMSLHPGPGAAWGKFLSQELFGKQMGGGKGGRQNGESKSMVRVCGSVGA